MERTVVLTLEEIEATLKQLDSRINMLQYIQKETASNGYIERSLELEDTIKIITKAQQKFLKALLENE